MGIFDFYSPAPGPIGPKPRMLRTGGAMIGVKTKVTTAAPTPTTTGCISKCTRFLAFEYYLDWEAHILVVGLA